MGIIRTSMGRKCCCLDQCTKFYKLSQCPDNTCLPEEGVFVSCAALLWLQKLGEPYYIFCFSELCCLIYNSSTELQEFDELPEGGFPIYSKTEGQTGTPIQGYVECVCDDCDVHDGACCFTFRGNTYCIETDKIDCYETLAAFDPEYWGDGTCCQQAGTDCDSDNPDSRLCTDPDNANCLLYVGRCYDKEDVETVCGNNGDAAGCDETVCINISFPQLTTYSGSGGSTTASCPPYDCAELAGDNTFCCEDTIQASSAECELVKDDPTQEEWLSVGGLQQGSALDEDWHKIATGLSGCCESNSGACTTCSPTIGGGQYKPCITGIDDWDCPCCGAVRHMDFLYSASVKSVGDCKAPCNTFQVDIYYYLGWNTCFGGIDCSTNGGCCSDPANDPDQICHSQTYGIRYQVTRPDCGCPVGLTSGDADYVREISYGEVQPEDTKCNHGCGCGLWNTSGIWWKVKIDEVIQGLSWTIS